MTSNPIHFGTSGWRGIIADDFTFDGVRIASAAIAAHVRSLSKKPTLLVGHDTRFFSPEFARAAATVLVNDGCPVLFCGKTPTPAIAFEIRRRKIQGAINITASHNPAAYNGLKFSGPDGAPALPEVTKDIEARAHKLSARPPRRPTATGHLANDSRQGTASVYPEARRAVPKSPAKIGALAPEAAEFETVDLREPYFKRLAELVRFDVIASSQLSFAYDALHGCGAGWLDALLAQHGIQVHAIRTERDVLFDGSGPDPSEENLKPLVKALKETKAGAGLATDGDADRFGILDRDGTFISPNHILALVFDYLIQSRGWKLGVARSVATTHLLDAIAKHHNVPVFETPVGFKYIGPYLERDKITLGGEESAGMTIRGHVPEKDGILACLLVAEMIAARRVSLAEQLKDLFHRVGRAYWPVRVNLHLSPEVIKGLAAKFKKAPSEFAGKRVKRTDRIDGLQLILDDDSWVLMRPSGTEPLVRVYAEAETPERSKQIAEVARTWITG